MISPTLHDLRYDDMGAGHYRAPRGNRLHAGTDFLCVPGQDIISPIYGTVKRIARPYVEGEYSGLLIEGEDATIKIFYIEPLEGIVGKHVDKYQVIGKAQDISKKYDGGMRPHVHVQIEAVDPERVLV